MPILINRRTRPNSLSFRGNEVTVGISRKRNESNGDRIIIIIRVRLFSFSLAGDFSTTLEMTTVYGAEPVRASIWRSRVRNFRLPFREIATLRLRLRSQ